MQRVAIVGDHGSGKMTFLGLLYAALVKSGSDKADDLRFRVGYDTLEEVTVLFERLTSGSFPDSATKEGIHGIGFDIGFRRSKRAALLHRPSHDWEADSYTTVQLALPGSLDEKTPGVFEGSTFGTGRWRDVLDADALIILADGTKLSAGDEDPESRPMAAYDRRLGSLFATIQRWRARGGRDVLHPLFVLTKFDSVKPDILRAANVDPTPPGVGESGPRAAYARVLLEPSLPRTLATVEEGGGKKFRFGPPDYFFSWVRTVAKGSGPSERIRLRRIDGGGWEPDYSRDEYLALVDRLGDIAARTKD